MLDTVLAGSSITVSSSSNWWERSFEEHSWVWFLISSVLGGFIGAFVKLAFENVLPFRLQEKRNIITVKRKYSTPILLASEALRNRLFNIIRLIEKIEQEKWLSRQEYYYTSTLYVISRFWGWVEILRRKVIYLDWQSTEETKRFENFIEAIEEGFSKPDLLYEPTGQTDWCYTYELSAIGEWMITQGDSEGEYRVMGYAEFDKLYKNNEEFKNWLKKLDRLFLDLNKNEGRFRRIIALHALVNHLINYLDPSHIYAKEQVNHLDKLTDSNEKNNIQDKLDLLN